MFDVGGYSGDHWSSLSLLKQRHVEPVVQNCVQMTFEYLQRWRLHNLSGQSQTVTVLGCPPSKKVFFDVQRETPVFQFVLIAPCSVTGHI